MSDALLPPMHAFNHAPAALRIFCFAADTASRVLELAHVSAFLRECAVEFGSADAALPGTLRNEHARGRFFKLRHVVERNAARCPWLAEKLLACRSGAPVPDEALAPDVTRHDVNWGAEGARRDKELQPTHGGYGLAKHEFSAACWAQGAVGVTSGKHFFNVCVTALGAGGIFFGFVDDKIPCLPVAASDYSTQSVHLGAAYATHGGFFFDSYSAAPKRDHPGVIGALLAPDTRSTCVAGCLLDTDATPARMTVFVDGEPLPVQCPYAFPKDSRAWYPSVALRTANTALHSCAI
jgi:hypothetical protein